MTLIDPKDDLEWASLDGRTVADMVARAGLAEATEVPWTSRWEPPGPIADAFYWDDSDIIGIRGPVGSGKTTTHLRSRFRRARMMPISNIDGIRRYKVVIARETYRQLWATTIPSWWEVMPKAAGKWSGGRGDPVTHLIHYEDEFGPIEFVAEFMAFGTSPTEIEANIRGVQTTDLALEEADTVPVGVVTKGVGRIDRYPQPIHFKAHGENEAYTDEETSFGQISSSYNSPDEDNWTVRVIEGANIDEDPHAATVRKEFEDQGIHIKFYRQPGFDEPNCENLQNLSAKYYPRQIASMKAEGRGNEVERLVYNRIGYVRVGDPVFKSEYKRNVHRSAVPLRAIPGVPLRIGLDQGQFGAAVIGQFIAPFQWRILGELWFKESVFAPKFGAALRDLLKERWPGHRIEGAWCDMAGNANESVEDQTWISEVSKATKIEIEPQMLGGNRIAPRLAVWRAAMDFEYFGKQGLVIDPSCKMLLRGLENDYVWAQEVDKAENKKRVPKKRGVRAADVIDAGGYMMLTESDMDGTPGTSLLMGDNGGPEFDDSDWNDRGKDIESYDFDPRGM
ncbi:MAG: hypothetical protein QM492_07075 [Rhodobacterales bacterium]